ncbi:MAG: hypothetical protein CMG69_03605 [Candidatus Marinimicrobia bacterium]|nr:hypothetical protein [Candidatus Neomarinimicrobiota bacterium]|tara:strand:+ start:15107 stop:18316 length:3210 start_codon:yes stop_codon:yes gene_type:complete
MNIIKTICITIFLATIVYSSTGSVSGTIASEGQVLPGANVSLIGSNLGAVTDSVGNYLLSRIPTGKYILRVDYIGYESQTKEIYITLYDLDEKNETGSVLIDKLGVDVELEESKDILKGNALKNVNFELVSSALGLNEVVVSAAKRKQKVTQAPSVVSLMKSVEIRRQVGVESYLRLISGLKGVDVNYFGVQGAQINARGFDGAFNTRFKQYNDGVDMGEIISGIVNTTLTSPPKESIDRVEVVFGPQSTLYGPDATTGILNILKKHPRTDDTNEINLSLSDVNKMRVGGRYSNVFDKFSFDIVFEGLIAKEYNLGNTEKDADGNYVDPVWFYGVYPDSSVDDFPWVEDWNNLPDTVSMTESDGWAAGYLDHDPTNPLNDRFYYFLQEDVYGVMDQDRYNFTGNFYYELGNDKELSLSISKESGKGYSMGSVSPIFSKNNSLNIDTKYSSNDHSLRYNYKNQKMTGIVRYTIAQSQADIQKDSVFNYMPWSKVWSDILPNNNLNENIVLLGNATRHILDYQYSKQISDVLQLVSGVDYQFVNPETERKNLNDYGYDQITKEYSGEDITEYRYGIYGQLTKTFSDDYELTASIRFDDHQYYKSNFSPKMALVKDNFLNGSLKLIAGSAFKAPTLTDRHLHNNLLNIQPIEVPYWGPDNPFFPNLAPWAVGVDSTTNPYDPEYVASLHAMASGNSRGFEIIDFNDNNWNFIYDEGDELINRLTVEPLKLEILNSIELAYSGLLNQYTLLDVNFYINRYKNLKAALGHIGTTGRNYMKIPDMEALTPGVISLMYNTDGTVSEAAMSCIGGVMGTGADEASAIAYCQGVFAGMVFNSSDSDAYIDTAMVYGDKQPFGNSGTNTEIRYGDGSVIDRDIWVLTYQSIPIEVDFYGLDIGLKYFRDAYEVSANLSYFDDSDLEAKRHKAENFHNDLLDDSDNDSTYINYLDFFNVYSNTPRLKYNFSLTLFDLYFNNLDLNLSVSGKSSYEFLSGAYKATKEGEENPELYFEGSNFHINKGTIGGDMFLNMNLIYSLNESLKVGFGINNILENESVTFPLTPKIPRSFYLDLGYEF